MDPGEPTESVGDVAGMTAGMTSSPAPLQAVIDDRPVDVLDGDTILRAAHRLGIDVPVLCYADGLAPEGGCRVCLVEVDGDDRPRAACHAPLRPGMRVRTTSPRLQELRRDILSLIAAEHAPGTFDVAAGATEFERLLARFDVDGPGFFGIDTGGPAMRGRIDASHPYLRFDPTLCVTCRRCVNACEQVQGQFVYDIAGRGAGARLIFGPSATFADSACVACGACVDHCPTGAIGDTDRAYPSTRVPDLPPAARATDSVCGYCGVGCRVRVEVEGDRVARIAGVPGAAVNDGHLCAKGRYAHGWHRHADRLTAPLLRDGRAGGFREVGWDEAVVWAARRLGEVQGAHGPDALGVLTSSRSTNEAAYLLQKLFRTRVGTNNIDCCARVCHASTALALQTVTGTGAATASYADIEVARCVVVAGANPTEAHPVVGARIKQAALRGAPLVVVDPRRIELAAYAEVHLAPRPGTNVALFNAIARVLLDEGWVDRAYLDARVEGLGHLAAFLAGLDVGDLAAIAGVDVAAVRRAAAIIGRAGGALFVTGLGLSELTQGVASVMALCNIGMLTGSIGRPGAGMLPLRGQNNVQGNADMGAMPSQVTGYQHVDDPDVRARLGAVWGAAPPARPGLTVTEMTAAALAGRVRGLWIQGEDIAQSDPDETHVLAALESLDLLIVQELFMTETARRAHLVLPAAGVLEQEGTFTNGERRIQHVRAALPPPGAARPDWEAIADVARAMGADWSYGSPADVMAEIGRVAPALFGGVRYDRLGGDGLQWPCPSPDHPGTATVHAGGFLRGRGQLVALDHVPSPEHDVEGYPWLLITGRVLQHYNVGTMTRRTPNRVLAPEDVLEIHPADAGRLGVQDGDRVAIESRWGRTVAPARVTDRALPGTLFLSFHFPETHANRVVGPHVDPESKCPQYKATAVRIRREGPSPGQLV